MRDELADIQRLLSQQQGGCSLPSVVISSTIPTPSLPAVTTSTHCSATGNVWIFQCQLTISDDAYAH
jgi:hypothetical protein